MNRIQMRYWKDVSHTDMHTSAPIDPMITALVTDLEALPSADQLDMLIQLEDAKVADASLLTHLLWCRRVATAVQRLQSPLGSFDD